MNLAVVGVLASFRGLRKTSDSRFQRCPKYYPVGGWREAVGKCQPCIWSDVVLRVNLLRTRGPYISTGHSQ